MYPLNQIDTSMYSLNQMVKPYWQSSSSSSSTGGTGTNTRGKQNKKETLTMKVYLSSSKEFNADFLIDEYQHKQTLATDGILVDTSNENDPSVTSTLPQKHFPKHDSILLWEEPYISTSKLSKSFILAQSTSKNNKTENGYDESSSSFQYAVKTLDDADQKEALLSTPTGSDGKAGSATSEAMNALLSNAGDGIETTSVILSLYKGLGRTIGKLTSFAKGSIDEEDNERKLQEEENKRKRVIVPISKKSSIWMNLMKNSTVQVHVILLRNQNDDHDHAQSDGRISDNFQQTLNEFRQKQSSYNLLTGGTSVVKHDIPHHITKPRRFLYNDIIYILQSYILQQSKEDSIAPWEMEYTKPEDYKIYKSSIVQKDKGVGYPYWKPEVSVKLVSDDTLYPKDFVGHSGMDVIRVNSKTKGGILHPSGYAYLPGLYVDEMGLTSEKYIPLNGTVDALPLRISFDSGLNYDDVDEGEESSSSSSGGLSPGRWRLLSHLSKTLESQKDLGFEQSDIDDIRRLIADTNVTLLGITILASTLHLLFEFLTFKNDVEFWQGNKDLTGLSVRALFMDFFSQFILLLFLIEKESSLLMTIPAAAGCLIALWKCQKGAGFQFVKCTKESLKLPVSVWNQFFRLFGYELHAMRLRAATASSKANGDKKDEEKDLATLTEEMDRLATNTIGKYLLLPLVLGYTVHTLMNEEHSGWYSWFITSASAVVYAVGFVMMTPQLFLNYKLKSVAHLPWKVLGYRFVNTFIDDLFAMIIRMPTMARISCFRDDVVFIIYLWQRYLYPVDTSRPVEGGGMDAISQAATTATIDSTEKDSVKKKKD